MHIEFEKGNFRWVVGRCRLARESYDAPVKQLAPEAKPSSGMSRGRMSSAGSLKQGCNTPPSGTPWNVVLQGPYRVDIERCWGDNCVAGEIRRTIVDALGGCARIEVEEEGKNRSKRRLSVKRCNCGLGTSRRVVRSSVRGDLSMAKVVAPSRDQSRPCATSCKVSQSAVEIWTAATGQA